MNGIGFKVDLPCYLALKAEAKKRKITLTEVCREAITEYVKKLNEGLVKNEHV